MFPLFLLITAIALSAGVALKLILDYQNHDVHITWPEYLITSAVILLAVIPLVFIGGWKMSVSNRMTYNEYLNGWEQEAQKEIVTCTEDGACRWTYQCDPYQVCENVCTSDGKTESCTTVCHTEYHNCPYCDQEWNYGIQTSLGFYQLEQGRFPDQPLSHVWREGEEPSQGLIDEAGVGDPVFWTKAKARIDSGLPGPVTTRHSYLNYIYASNLTILKHNKEDIEYYKQKGMLPTPPSAVTYPYLARKVLVVNYSLGNNDSLWQKNVNYLNAGLGSLWQGDLTFVIVNSQEITQNPDRYISALKAYLTDGDLIGKDAASKNALIVVGGTDGQKLIWTRAFTTMPIGNTELTERIQTVLTGLPLNPDSVIGKTRYQDFKTIITNGPLASTAIVSDVHYKRESMTAFAYLKDEIEPTHGQKVFLVVLAIVFSLLCWLGPIYHPDYRNTFSTRGY